MEEYKQSTQTQFVSISISTDITMSILAAVILSELAGPPPPQPPASALVVGACASVGAVAGGVVGLVAAAPIRIAENVYKAKNHTQNMEQRNSYQLGDISKGLIARGKNKRDACSTSSYQFGDFTRGLLG